MAPGFRQRSHREILLVVKKHALLIILPTVAFGLAFVFVVSKLPGSYKSTSLLTIKSPRISDKIVEPLSGEDMSRRLQALTQSILSRSSLEELIVKNGLYQESRKTDAATDVLLDRVRKNISVEVEKDGPEKVVGFRISYIDSNPETARRMTDALADQYVARQIDESVLMVETTSEFIDKQLYDAKAQLDELEQQRLKIMLENADTLPESSQGLIAQLEGLRKREETIGKEKEVLSVERGRLNDQIASNNRQASLIEDFGVNETQEAVKQASQIEDTPAFAQLVNKRADLSGQLDKLLKMYKEKHPEVIAKRDEIARVNEEIETLRKSTDRRQATASQTTSRKVALQKRTLELENQRLQSQIGLIERQIETKDRDLVQNTDRIAVLEEKINRIPDIRIALEGITSRYESAKAIYDDLLKKYNSSQGQVRRESNSQGETIVIVDRANLPTAPTNSGKKIVLILAGFGLGFGLGGIFAAVIELPRFFRVQNLEDMRHHSNLPALFAVPVIRSDAETTRRKWLIRLGIFAGLVLTAASVPVLIFLIQKTHIVERFV